MGYYDPYPQVILGKPVCLIGFMGSEVHHITYFLSSMTGIPFIELDKLIEHDVGMSLAQLYLEEGETRWRAREEVHLKRALDTSPPRLICLGDGALIAAENRRLCLQKADVLYVRRPREVLLENIQRGRREVPGRFPYWSTHAPQGIEDLTELLRRRESTYEAAPHMIDAGELTALEIAQKLIRRFKWFSEE